MKYGLKGFNLDWRYQIYIIYQDGTWEPYAHSDTLEGCITAIDAAMKENRLNVLNYKIILSENLLEGKGI